jgi:hypothetical protein
MASTKLRPVSVSPEDRPGLPPRKPMATTRKVALFEREIRIKLSPAALDLLFDAAEVLSEGQRHGERYFGSTMITIDLTKLAPVVREDCDAASAKRVAELLAADARVVARAKHLAAADAGERAGGPLREPLVELKARHAGSRVQLDLDVEGDLDPRVVQLRPAGRRA